MGPTEDASSDNYQKTEGGKFTTAVKKNHIPPAREQTYTGRETGHTPDLSLLGNDPSRGETILFVDLLHE